MNAVANISAALGYDAVESMLAAGRSLADCLAFAAMAAESVDVLDIAPESARTVLAVDAATVRPAR